MEAADAQIAVVDDWDWRMRLSNADEYSDPFGAKPLTVGLDAIAGLLNAKPLHCTSSSSNVSNNALRRMFVK